jgi:hypothetical protein
VPSPERGLTHVHLLPAFDIASVDEDKSHWKDPATSRPMRRIPTSSRRR